jgi:hypothetical protein
MTKALAYSGTTKGGSITVPLTSCLTGLDKSVLQIKTQIVSCHTADSEPVKQDVKGTVILPPLVFPGLFICRSVGDGKEGVDHHGRQLRSMIAEGFQFDSTIMVSALINFFFSTNILKLS